MRSRMFRWVLSATLVGGALTASADPNVRDHRKGPRFDVNAKVVVDAGPREAPPPPRAESSGPRRRGFVWVEGNWEWRRGQWQWQAGHWERSRRGKHWRGHRWEKRGDVYVRVEGGWDDAPAYPNAAPPAPMEEKWSPKRGYVWVKGRWDWQDGDWQWTAGHWERERAQFTWQDGHWEQQNGRWTWIDGQWAQVQVAMYPTAAPPAPQAENVRPKRGHIWIKGRWDWKNGAWAWTPGHWERERAQFTWQDGSWQNQNGKWVWVEGQWVQAAPQPPVVVATYPTQAPPAPQAENITAKAGFIWVKGRWDWKNGQWAWSPGHWERERAQFQWQDGRWESKNGQWVWVEGSWVASAPMPQPQPQPAPQPAPPPSPPPGPTQAPPAPQAEQVPGARSGFIWVKGHWGWQGNQYAWTAGHWERAQAQRQWVDGHWEQRSQGNQTYWVWIEGSWR